MHKKKTFTVNGKTKQLPAHILGKKKGHFQKKKKQKNKKMKNKPKKQHMKSATIAMQDLDPQSIAMQNLNNYNNGVEHADEYISSDTSAEWFDGDSDSDSKAYGAGGYLRVRIGDKLNNRYIIESKLGWGHFSTVWLSTDLLAPQHSYRRFVALKIQKSAPHYLDAARDEVELLSAAKLKSKHRHNKSSKKENHIVQLLDSFIVNASNGKHVVFVFEVLGENLLDLIKSYNYRGLPMAIVKKIAREVLLGLDYLHNECNIIHTDLKPENVLISRTKDIDVDKLEGDKNRELKKQYQRQLNRFESGSTTKRMKQKMNELKKKISLIDKQYLKYMKKEQDAELKVGQFEFIHDISVCAPIFKICDLGNACWSDKHFTDDITTRQYRAPESILQCGYDSGVDIWSLACMIFELLTGDYLFDPREKQETKDDAGYCRDADHLALIGELCGNKKIGETWPKKWTKCDDDRFNIAPLCAFDANLAKVRAAITQRPGLVTQFFGGYKIIKSSNRDIKWQFTQRGDELSNIQKLDYWSLAAVLEEKYKLPKQLDKKYAKSSGFGHNEAAAGSLAHFLGRMLEIDPAKRATAKELLNHSWLQITAEDIENCVAAEKHWLQTNGKPIKDTNAVQAAEFDDDEDNEEDSDDDDDDLYTSDEEEDEGTENKEDSITSHSRSRDSSVDPFINSAKRAQSHDPFTWHRHIGIKWYQQFEGDQFDMRCTEKQEESEEEEDLYEMDPNYDPYRDEEEEESEDSDSSDADEAQHVHNNRVSLIIEAEEEEAEVHHKQQASASMIILDPDDEDLQLNDLQFSLQQLGIESIDYENDKLNGYKLSQLDENENEQEADDNISPLPTNFNLHHIPSASNGSFASHSRASSSTSTFDID